MYPPPLEKREVKRFYNKCLAFFRIQIQEENMANLAQFGSRIFEKGQNLFIGEILRPLPPPLGKENCNTDVHLKFITLTKGLLLWTSTTTKCIHWKVVTQLWLVTIMLDLEWAKKFIHELANCQQVVPTGFENHCISTLLLIQCSKYSCIDLIVITLCLMCGTCY